MCQKHQKARQILLLKRDKSLHTHLCNHFLGPATDVGWDLTCGSGSETGSHRIMHYLSRVLKGLLIMRSRTQGDVHLCQTVCSVLICFNDI